MGGVGNLPFTGFGEPARIGAQNSVLRQFLARYGETPPEPVFVAMGQEACRHRTDRCATVLAAWGQHHPESQQLREALAGVRQGAGFGGPLPPDLVADLRSLLAGGPNEISDVTPAVAERATTLYREYYDHGFAFDPARLRSYWQRCRAPGDACTRGRQAAEQLLARE
jgi:hypothetical protein